MRDNRGMSLVELITSIAIFGMVAAAALSMILFATRTNEDITIDTMHNIKVVSAFDLMKEQVRMCEKIDIITSEIGEGKKEIEIRLYNSRYSEGENGTKTYDSYYWSKESGKLEYKYWESNDLISSVVLLENIENLNYESFTETGSDSQVVRGAKLEFEFRDMEHDPMQLVISCRNK